jgi:hypothetical protein
MLAGTNLQSGSPMTEDSSPAAAAAELTCAPHSSKRSITHCSFSRKPGSVRSKAAVSVLTGLRRSLVPGELRAV